MYEDPSGASLCSTWHAVPAKFPFLAKEAVGDEGTITGVGEGIMGLAKEKAEPEGFGVKRPDHNIGEPRGCEGLREGGYH